MSSAICSEATEFDCTFSWSLAIRVLAVYVGYNKFRFAIRSMIHLDEIYRPWYWVQKVFSQSKCEYWKKISTRFINQLESSQSCIWLTMGFNEFSMTSVKSGLMIKGLNHTITARRSSYFYSTGSPLHTARCHWWIVRLIGRHLDDRWSSKGRIENISIHRKEFRWYCDRDHNIYHYQIEWNLWGHTLRDLISNLPIEPMKFQLG